MKAAANKVSSVIKRTMSATDVTKAKQPRRVSEDGDQIISLNRNKNHLDKSPPTPQPPKLEVEHPHPLGMENGIDSGIIPIKKIKEEIVEDSDEDKDSDSSDEEEPNKRASPVKYPFR